MEAVSQGVTRMKTVEGRHGDHREDSDGVEHTVTADDGNSFNVSVAPGSTTTYGSLCKPVDEPFGVAVPDA